MEIFVEHLVNPESYFVVKYYISTRNNLANAAWNIAIGQSVGNPNVRSVWETEELFADHSCLILGNKQELKQQAAGFVDIAFPIDNIDFQTDGISHLLVNIMGGQLDIDFIDQCKVIDIVFPPSVYRQFPGPRYGIKGIREFTGVPNYKPLLGAIMKPKTGVSPQTMLDMVKALVDGGVNFIKEDEILSNPSFCKIQDRVPLIMKWLNKHAPKVIYSVSIHSDHHYLLRRVQNVYDYGGNSVHVNFWCGMGAYKAIRERHNIFLHFQKSGDKIFTNYSHNFMISWDVVARLAAMCGVDFAHAGMIGGYYKWGEAETNRAVRALQQEGTMPALSCGFHPGLVDKTTKIVGPNYMANVGGAIHGHPGGTTAGALAMRQAIDGTGGPEYDRAIEEWGYEG